MTRELSPEHLNKLRQATTQRARLLITAEYLHQEMAWASENHQAEEASQLKKAYDILHKKINDTLPPGDDDVSPPLICPKCGHGPYLGRDHVCP
jgi:hypothetical protein